MFLSISASDTGLNTGQTQRVLSTNIMYYSTLNYTM
jgi:hypothetical protein